LVSNGAWYIYKDICAMKPPHLLPRFVPVKLVLQEVAY
jgi:hypothetical protein